MMKRKVIIVEGSSVKDLDDLPGAQADTLNWRNFLRTSYGGAWGERCFSILKNPTPDMVLSCIRANRVGYLMVIFSGHGFHAIEENDDFICLNPNKTGERHLSVHLIEENIREYASCGTLIIDACRGSEEGVKEKVVYKKAVNEGMQQRTFCRTRKIPIIIESDDSAEKTIVPDAYWMDLFLTEKKLPEKEYVNQRFTYYKNWINNCNLDVYITMKACAITQSADEYIFEQDGRMGGHFTCALLDAVKQWKNQQQMPHIPYTTLNAFDDAEKLMPDSQQTPEYSPDGEEQVFAFS